MPRLKNVLPTQNSVTLFCVYVHLKKEEELRLAEERIRGQQASISQLELDKDELNQSLIQANKATDIAILEIERISVENQRLASLLQTLEQQLAQQKQQTDETRSELASAESEISVLTQSSIAQQESISGLTQEKLLLNREIAAYNQQLLTLKGDYETVKSKYEELIKPARSAKGKFIVEVYYVKGNQGEIIRFKQPGDANYINLSLTEVEKHLDKLKQQKGKDLYVKIIIPENSGLTYNEALDVYAESSGEI